MPYICQVNMAHRYLSSKLSEADTTEFSYKHIIHKSLSNREISALTWRVLKSVSHHLALGLYNNTLLYSLTICYSSKRVRINPFPWLNNVLCRWHTNRPSWPLMTLTVHSTVYSIVWIILTLSVLGQSLYVRIWRPSLYVIFWRILTYKDGPRTERIKIFIWP